MADTRLEPLVLTGDERRTSENWVKRRSTAQGLALRARIVASRWLARKVTLDLISVVENAVGAAGYQAWRDEPSLTAGDPFARKIDAALLSCAGGTVRATEASGASASQGV